MTQRTEKHKKTAFMYVTYGVLHRNLNSVSLWRIKSCGGTLLLPITFVIVLSSLLGLVTMEAMEVDYGEDSHDSEKTDTRGLKRPRAECNNDDDEKAEKYDI